MQFRALGASWIGVSEPALTRRQTALEHSASAVFDPLASDVIPQVLSFLAPGAGGVDIVFDCAGIQASLNTALKVVRPRGNVVDIAVWGTEAKLDMGIVMFKEIILTGKLLIYHTASDSLTISLLGLATIGYDKVHAEVIKLLAEGNFPGIEKFITRKIGFEDVVEKGIKALVAEKDTQSAFSFI